MTWPKPTSSILLDIKLSQKPHGIITAPASFDLIARLNVASISATRRKRGSKNLPTARESDGWWLWVRAHRRPLATNGEGIGVDAEDATGATKLVINCAKVDLLNTKLSKE
jgi:hypothetical protein